MARGRLHEEDIAILRANPYVSDVDENRIIYTNEFKRLFMTEYQDGKKPTQIFKEAGFDPKILGSKRIERAAHRWKESYASGSLGSYRDAFIRRPMQTKSPFTAQLLYENCLEELEQQKKRIEELEAENERLRKLVAG